MPSLVTGPLWGEHLPDALLFAIALAATVLCLTWLGIKAGLHRRNLRAIPVRIHVTGTRGKSTTTRLIAAGLRAGGIRVLAKATGSQPRLILPDGSEEDWPRRGPASIREQVRLFSLAHRLKVDAVVVECMAIRPEMIWASEQYLVRATMAVITNARADHYEDVGENPAAMAEALRWAAPENGNLVVDAQAATNELRQWAASRGTIVGAVDTSGLGAMEANRTLALAVCAAHGVSAEIAGAAMDKAPPDPGLYFERDLSVAGKSVRFANAFACNDIDSLALIWEKAKDGTRPVVLLNARADRPLRSKHFLEFLAAQVPRPILFIVGDRLAARLARRAGFQSDSIRRLRAGTAEAAIVELAGPAESGAMIWGIGNYYGFGARLVAQWRDRELPC